MCRSFDLRGKTSQLVRMTESSEFFDCSVEGFAVFGYVFTFIISAYDLAGFGAGGMVEYSFF